MASGNVMTARGAVLNMEELILAAKRPMSMKNVDQKDKIETKKQPPRQLNIRGFVPSAAGVKQTVQAESPVPETPSDDEGRSLADLTGVTLKKPRFMKGQPTDAAQMANETLQEIMGDLEHFKNRESVEPPPQRRSRKTT